jgi:hypothetical protein
MFYIWVLDDWKLDEAKKAKGNMFHHLLICTNSFWAEGSVEVKT